MRHGPKVWTEKVIDERVKAGIGAGGGESYKPWLSVHDLSSRGRQTRVSMRKIARVVHVHSNIELALLRLAEYAKNFHGVCEQFPLPREITLGAAESLGIRHPTYSVSHAPVVMTLDFLLETVTPDGEIIKTPWDCKREDDLKNPRILEKLSIHRATCAHLGLAPARIFTELSAPKHVVHNVEWIRATLPLEGEPAYIHKLYDEEPDALFNDILLRGPHRCIADHCSEYDKRRGFERGTALRVFGWLLWAHRLPVNLNARSIPQQPLNLPSATALKAVA